MPAVTALEALHMLDGSAVLIDVREANEWEAGHAPQAIHVAMSQLSLAGERLSHEVPMIVICRTGRRSDAVVGALKQAGLHAVNLTGGMQAWQQVGGAVVRDDGTPGTVI
jgi:rhodanese-related sulfurtransferase